MDYTIAYESEVVTSLLNNRASWIGLTDEIVDKLQQVDLRRENDTEHTDMVLYAEQNDSED